MFSIDFNIENIIVENRRIIYHYILHPFQIPEPVGPTIIKFNLLTYSRIHFILTV